MASLQTLLGSLAMTGSPHGGRQTVGSLWQAGNIVLWDHIGAVHRTGEQWLPGQWRPACIGTNSTVKRKISPVRARDGIHGCAGLQ